MPIHADPDRQPCRKASFMPFSSQNDKKIVVHLRGLGRGGVGGGCIHRWRRLSSSIITHTIHSQGGRSRLCTTRSEL